MASGLIDSSIIIDLLRGYPPALEWIGNQTSVLAVSRPSVLEILQGVRDKTHQRRALTMLNRFEIIPLDDVDAVWASQQLVRFQLSHNIGVIDALIAGVAHRLQLPFYTRNIKHFAPMLGMQQVQSPY